MTKYKTPARRGALVAAGAALSGLLVACGAPGAGGDDTASYPTKTVEVIVPYPAGGASDIVARLMVDELNSSEVFDGKLQVVNQPGGAGVLGMTELVGAPKDGYTISISPVGPVSMHPATTEVSYDPRKDLTFVAGLTADTIVIAVPASSPYQTMTELVAAAKASPDTVTMGGGPPAYAVPQALLEQKTGAKFQSVAFDGDAATTTALLGENVDAAFTQPSAVQAQVAAGEIRLLGTFSGTRSDVVPEVPTMAEQGIDVVRESSYGIYAPAGIPEEAMEVLTSAAQEAVESPQTKEKAAAIGVDLRYRDSDTFKAFMLDGLSEVETLVQDGLL